MTQCWAATSEVAAEFHYRREGRLCVQVCLTSSVLQGVGTRSRTLPCHEDATQLEAARRKSDGLQLQWRHRGTELHSSA